MVTNSVNDQACPQLRELCRQMDVASGETVDVVSHEPLAEDGLPQPGRKGLGPK